MSFLPFRIGAGRRNLSSATRSRVLAAPPAEVWEVVEDPYQMPRWWPSVERMEGVEDDRFTQVFKTRRRRTVRADFRVLASEPPGGSTRAGTARGRRRWRERRSSRSCTSRSPRFAVEPADGGTKVTIAQRQRLRGYSKTGALAMRSATGKRLDEALDGLERILG